MSASENTHPINAKDWADVYPTPKDRTSTSPLPLYDVEAIEQRMRDGQRAGREFVVVDVRRTDCTSMIPGAINLPAHSLFAAAPTLVTLFEHVPLLLFHCNRSNGRGPRAAGWFADELQRQRNMTDEEVARRVGIVKGGIVAWEDRFGAGTLDRRGTRNDENERQSVPL